MKEPAFGIGIAAAVTEKYFPTAAVARTLGIRPDILGRIIGYSGARYLEAFPPKHSLLA